MRIIVFLLIAILQRSSCVNESLLDILNIPRHDKEKDNFLTHTDTNDSLRDGNGFQIDAKPDSEGFFHGTRMWPMMKQDKRSNRYPYQNVPPLSVFKSIRRKRPDKSHMEKLAYLLNNYRENVEPPEINFEEGNKKRTHLFGFWTNYLARN